MPALSDVRRRRRRRAAVSPRRRNCSYDEVTQTLRVMRTKLSDSSEHTRVRSSRADRPTEARVATVSPRMQRALDRGSRRDSRGSWYARLVRSWRVPFREIRVHALLHCAHDDQYLPADPPTADREADPGTAGCIVVLEDVYTGRRCCRRPWTRPRPSRAPRRPRPPARRRLAPGSTAPPPRGMRPERGVHLAGRPVRAAHVCQAL
jgi:hypothetical protein